MGKDTKNSSICCIYLLPNHKNIIPIRISTRSIAFERRFFSRKSIAPQTNDTTTDERRIIETTDIIASSRLSAVRYAKSAAESKIDIIGIAHDQ